MRPKEPGNRDLPPRMIRRTRKLKSGKVWVAYYYNQTLPGGGQKEIPLGGDLDEAKAEWARLERTTMPKSMKRLGDVFDRYEREIVPSKATRTQRDNLLSLKQLRVAFSDAPVEAVTPQVIAQYRDKRTAKVRANREIALLSHVYNIAREWGITNMENPAKGVRKNKETPRDFYARDEVWNAVYAHACIELRDAMDLAYLTAQRRAGRSRSRYPGRVLTGGPRQDVQEAADQASDRRGADRLGLAGREAAGAAEGAVSGRAVPGHHARRPPTNFEHSPDSLRRGTD